MLMAESRKGFILAFFTALVLMITACSTNNIAEVQKSEKADLEKAIAANDYVAASRELERLTSGTDDTKITNHAVALVKTQANYHQNLAAAYRERIESVASLSKCISSIANFYKRI